MSLIRHFIMSFTLFLRVSDRYPCRKCLNVRNDGIGDALDNDDGQNVSLAKTHFLYIRTFTRPYHGHVNNNHAYSRSLFFSFILFIHTTLYGVLLSRFQRIFFCLLLLLLQLFPPRYVFTTFFLFSLSSHVWAILGPR